MRTQLAGDQVLNNSIGKEDLIINQVGNSVVTNLIQGSGISISQTGADTGTGEVTITNSSPDAKYIHQQAVPTSSISITHNLNKKPSILVYDTSDNSEIFCDIQYTNLNTVQLTLSQSMTFEVYFS